jgi:glycine oxidase
MLAPHIEADGSDPLFELAVAARDHYGQLAGALRESTGIDIGLWQGGIARIATDRDEAAALQVKVEWQRNQGHSTDWLEDGELRRRWPWLSPTVGALWAPLDGSLDPGRLVPALLADAQRRGARMVTDRAISVSIEAGRVTGVNGDRDRYTASNVIIAAGAWSPLIQGLPRQLPVQPVRGQMVALAWSSADERAIVYHNDVYLLSRGGEAIVGSTMETVGYRPEVTQDGLARLRAVAASLSPTLASPRVRRSWAGLRPMTPDGLPLIGRDPEVEGLWYATGHGRNGILLAGLTGVILAQLLHGEQPPYPLQVCALERFASSLSEPSA